MKIGSIEPEVVPLRKLYTEEWPSLYVPSIQRQFVWDAEDVKKLIDSIINGYPIGAVIIWESGLKFPGAPLANSGAEPDNIKYILDGQQRLTALMLIKNKWELQRGERKVATSPISFVPENEKLYVSKQKGIDISLIVNAALGEPDALAQLLQKYPTLFKKAIDTVGARIINYGLPFYILKSNDKVGDEVYEQVAEIFTRVNSAGVRLGNLDMFLSFFAAAFPKEEKDRIIAIHEKLSERFELDLEPLVRFVFSRMGMSQNQITKHAAFKKAIQSLKDKYSEEPGKISEILACAHKSITAVIELLDSELGVSTTQYVPSQNVLLPLFDAAFERGYEAVKDITLEEKRRMLKWFLLASFNGIYSSSPNHKIEDDLATIRANKGFPLDDLLSAIESRPPRRNKIERNDIVGVRSNILRGRTGREYLMLLDIALYKKGATDLAGSPIKSEEAHVHHIFPREFLKDNDETRDEMINCLGNLTLISSSVDSEIGDTPPEEYLPGYSEEALSQHFIPTDKKLWKLENFEGFLDARLELIWKEIEALLDNPA